jgi:hypothetical protein
MALSPNYGFPEPDNSSLVKNGAQDIRALGDAIDTSVWNVGFGQAGKNKLINSDFSINQRSFTSSTTSAAYGFDRWLSNMVDGTTTYSAQTFTAGAAPEAGYEATNFARIVTTGQTLSTAQSTLSQKIESVRTFAGQTVTVSFWAKANTGTPKIATELVQNFGSGGSAATLNYAGQSTLSTSWQRFNLSILVPSISGKTIGTSNFLSLNLWVSAGSDLNSRTGSLGIQSNTFDIWGVQVEYGSKATPFQTASGGSPQAELAMCQRYYVRYNAGSDPFTAFVLGVATGTTAANIYFQVPTQLRVPATSLDYSTLGVAAGGGGIVAATLAVLLSYQTTKTVAVAITTAGGLTVGQTLQLFTNNSTSAFIGFSAEL